ncbi:MAG TPA: ABC transporter permease subunit [Paracoccus sp. (in: a-proteobacteria)]|nr:ABC transporter permease subunit [Paracoccus sp. (in: a-proteobacteria)]
MRALLSIAAALLAWEALVRLTGLPPFLLPGPWQVAQAVAQYRAEIAQAAIHTAGETLAGLALGAGLGVAVALAMAVWPRLGRALGPVLIVSQTIPIFALAPILTLWLGFGYAPKIAMVVLIVFVPVAQALYDGLMAPPPAQMDVALSMGASRWSILRHLLASGLRLGTIYAPVGAVIGEWVGGARGLGALMIQANGRMRTDLMFAALVVVVALSLMLYATVDRLLAHWLARRGFAERR